MKKNLFIALLLSFLFSGCFDLSDYFGSSPKCDNKKALRLLEDLVKNGMKERYQALIYGVKDLQKASQVAPKGGIDLNEMIEAHKAYIDKDVKVEFSLFRTQQEDKEKKLRYCRAEATITFPDTPPFLKTSEKFLKAYYWGIQKQNNEFSDKELEAIVSGNAKRKDDIWYQAEFTDNKQVYVEWLPEGMEGFY